MLRLHLWWHIKHQLFFTSSLLFAPTMLTIGVPLALTTLTMVCIGRRTIAEPPILQMSADPVAVQVTPVQDNLRRERARDC